MNETNETELLLLTPLSEAPTPVPPTPAPTPVPQEVTLVKTVSYESCDQNKIYDIGTEILLLT